MKTLRILTAFLLIVGVIAVGWNFLNSRNNEASSSTPETHEEFGQVVSPEEAVALVKDKNVFVLDVHTPEQLHIPGTDAFISYDQLEENQDKLPEDKSTPILVYCRSGSMSAIAAKTLSQLGYTNIHDLEGGIQAYRHATAGEVILEPSTYDLGTVIYGDVATTEFTLTNFSDESLNISSISTSCGCTKAEAEKTELEPYSSTTIDVSFDPAVHKDDSDLGDITRTIYIETDNSQYSEIQGTITATVVK